VPGLPRDIETICLKCLEKGPHRRYASAQELADDLKRMLDGTPIHARPVSAWERLLKWTRRKPAWAALLAVSTLALVAIIVGSVVHQRQLREALNHAKEHAERARQQQQRAAANYDHARDAIGQILAANESRRFADIPKIKELRQRQLESALAFYLTIAEQYGDDAEVRHDTARARLEAGRIQFQLGQKETAAANFMQARDGFAALADEAPSDPRFRVGLATSLYNLAQTCLEPRKFSDALAFDHQALDIREALLRTDPDSPEYRAALAGSNHSIGSIHYQMRQLENAESFFIKANSLRSRLTEQYPDSDDYRMSLAQTQLNLSLLYQNTRRPAEMREFHDLAEANLTGLVRDDPNDYLAIYSLAQLRVNWAYVLQAEGHTDMALEEMDRNVELVEPALAAEPNSVNLRDAMFRSEGMRYRLLDQSGRLEEAVTACRRCAEFAPAAQRTFHRLFLPMALVRAGHHEQAANEVDEIVAQLPADVSPDWLEHLAQVLSIASTKARAEIDQSPTDRSALAERYVTGAIELLSRVRATEGDEKWQRRAANLTKNDDFEPLRNSTEFKALLDMQ
jgi:tetratricopeptide (TPR) repeat protein